jgi:WD40 repeat protein
MKLCSVDWNPAGTFIASGGGDNSISLFSVERDASRSYSLARTIRVEEAHSADINCVRYVHSNLAAF